MFYMGWLIGRNQDNIKGSEFCYIIANMFYSFIGLILQAKINVNSYK